MTNHEYIASTVLGLRNGNPRVLDYGCGSGELVSLLLSRGLDAYGCDVFYGGGDRSGGVPARLMDVRVHRMEDGRIPFPDETFGLVVSNQVLEHVPDMELVASEQARVLERGGIAFNVFPCASVWLEGHCGIPFIHWFPRKSKVRYYYALCLRCLGMGMHKTNGLPDSDTRRKWARAWCSYVDEWTHYRSEREVLRIFSRHFEPPEMMETHWLSTRWPKLSVLPQPAQRFIARKGGTRVFAFRKV